jgi:hypothetical protein
MAIQIQNLDMHSEMNRLYTYSNPVLTFAHGKPSPIQLARIGLYLNETHTAVVCHICKIVINWGDLDLDPVLKHERLSPNCPVTSGTTTDLNVPLPDPAAIVAKFENDPSLSDTLDGSDTTKCISLPSIRKLYQLLTTSVRHSNLQGIPAVTDYELVPIDRNNPDLSSEA